MNYLYGLVIYYTYHNLRPRLILLSSEVWHGSKTNRSYVTLATCSYFAPVQDRFLATVIDLSCFLDVWPTCAELQSMRKHLYCCFDNLCIINQMSYNTF